MRRSQTFKDRKYSWPPGMGTSNWGASRNLGSSVLSSVSAAPRSLISAFLQNYFFLPLSFFWCSVKIVESDCLRRPSLICSFLSPLGPQLCLAQCWSCQQRLPRTSQMFQSPILRRGSDWSSQVRCSFLNQSAVAKRKVLSSSGLRSSIFRKRIQTGSWRECGGCHTLLFQISCRRLILLEQKEAHEVRLYRNDDQ